MRMKHVTTPLIAMLLAVPLATAAESKGKPDFGEVDADGDGKVTVSEATDSGVPKAEAEREDIDNDGELTKADWKFVDMNPDSGSESDADSS